MKILLIRFSSLGDVILTTSVARNIKINDPTASVDILTKPEYASVFENNPDFNDVLFSISRNKKYDYVVDLHNNIRSNLIKYFFSAKKRLTYNKAVYARRIYVHTRYMGSELKKTVVDRYLEPLSEIGFDVSYIPPVFIPTEQELEDAKKLVKTQKYIAIAPGSKWRTKEWIMENYIGLAVRIIRDLGVEIVLLGSSEDVELSNKIYKGVGTLKSHITDLTGKTSIREFAAVIKNSSILVSTDSGAMHLGCAVDKEIVAIFGPTVKEFGFQPQGEKIVIVEKKMKCRPCSLHGSNKCRYGDHACMQRIEIYEVFDEIKKYLDLSANGNI